MKRLRDITTRASLNELVEALIEATVVDGETAPEVKPEGEKEFVKLHKTEKHPDPYGNKGSEAMKKDKSKAAAEPKPGFPKEVREEEELNEIERGDPDPSSQNPWMWKLRKHYQEKREKKRAEEIKMAHEKNAPSSKHFEPAFRGKGRVKEETELDEAHPAWPNKSRHPSMRKPAKPIGKKKSGKWEAREDDQGNVFYRRVGSKKWDTTRRTDEEQELDESGAIAKAKGKAVLISRPKFDARGNVILTKNAKENITVGKKPRKLSGKNWEPGKKRFGEEKEQLDELKMKTLGSYISKAVPSKKFSDEGQELRKKHGWDRSGALARMSRNRDKGIDRAAQRLGGTFEVGKPVSVMIPGKGDNDKASGPYKMKRKKIYTMKEDQLDEKAVSKAQQRFMGMVHAVQKGESDRGSEKVMKAAADMKYKDARDFAKTKHKGLPERKGKD